MAQGANLLTEEALDSIAVARLEQVASKRPERLWSRSIRTIEGESKWSPEDCAYYYSSRHEVTEQYYMDAVVDASTGRVIEWRDRRHELPATGLKVSEEEALEIAEGAEDIPFEAVLKGVFIDLKDRLVPYEKGAEALRAGSDGRIVVWWTRAIDGVPVERDGIWVIVHPTTGEVVGVTRVWREVEY